MAYLDSNFELRSEARELLKKYRHIFRVQESSPSRFEGETFLTEPEWSTGTDSSRFTNLDWVLSSQGDFLELYRKSIDSLMDIDGPLPRPWRHYIAMIGASCHSCEYLVRNQFEQYLLVGGDPEWFREGGSPPHKLTCLMETASMMAHQPWALNSVHIEYLTSTGRWSSSELRHALMILATFLSLPSLIFGAGIRLEDDLSTDSEYVSARSPDPLVQSEPCWDPEDGSLPKCFTSDPSPSLLQRLFRTSVSLVGEEPFSAFEGFAALGETNTPGGSGMASPQVRVPTTPVGGAMRMDRDEKEELAAVMAAGPVWSTPMVDWIKATANRPLAEYRDFSLRKDSTLHTMTFSWEDHAMMILGRQLPDATDSINDENLHVLTFSSKTIGDHPIESTATVREAITKYVQRMYGIFHDDYHYDKLNKILPVIHKAYLKKLACFPEKITTVDFMRMRKFENFNTKDLIHYAHLVFQTRRIAALTWATKALPH